jgi:cell division initiation protein
MEVSPKTLREVEFREKMRGYHPEDVDQFLEQVAAGIEVLQDRLRQAAERAQRAEQAASDTSATDDTLRRTLVLAQRTADMAVAEAREQASRIIGSAQQQADSIVSEAEQQGRRTLEDAISEARSELSRLESQRSQVQLEVETLQRWLEEHKSHVVESLSEALSAVERLGTMWPAPSLRGGDSLSRRNAAVPASPAAPAPVIQVESDPPARQPASTETAAWPAVDAEATQLLPTQPDDTDPSSSAGGDAYSDDRAMDDFFDDNDRYVDDHRIGGRLRRRR